MSCEELNESYELYALGVLDGAEYEELEGHLNRNCPTCMKEIRRAVEDNATVLRAIPKVEPPSRLRSRILAGFGLETKSLWMRTLPWTLASASVLLLLIFWIAPVRKTTGAPDVNSRVVEFLNSPGTAQFTFGGNGTAPQGRVLVSQPKGLLLVVGNLASPPAGKMYETWIIPRTGAPRPVGQLVASGGGALVGLIPGPVDVTGIKAVAVSEEPAGANPVTPTKVLFAAPTE